MRNFQLYTPWTRNVEHIIGITATSYTSGTIQIKNIKF